MSQTLDLFKKVGATVIVLLLVVMMAVTFSSQPMDEIVDVITGQARVGSFDGERISTDAYHVAYSSCQENYAAFGEVPDFILHGCLQQQLQALYVLPALAEQMGLQASRKSVERELRLNLYNDWRYQHESGVSDEDIMPLDELYRRALGSYPMDIRVREANIVSLLNHVGQTFPFPGTLAAAESSAEQARIELTLISFDENDLPADRASAIRSRLADGGSNLTPEEVAAITGLTPRRLVIEGLSGLQNLRHRERPMSLAVPAFLAELSPSAAGTLSGPHADDDITFYTRIESVATPAADGVESELMAQEQGRYMAMLLLDQLVQIETDRGHFLLYINQPEESGFN